MNMHDQAIRSAYFSRYCSIIPNLGIAPPKSNIISVGANHQSVGFIKVHPFQNISKKFENLPARAVDIYGSMKTSVAAR